MSIKLQFQFLETKPNSLNLKTVWRWGIVLIVWCSSQIVPVLDGTQLIGTF